MKFVNPSSPLPAESASSSLLLMKEKIQGVFMAFLAIGYILHQFFPHPWIGNTVSVLIIAIVISLLPQIRGSTLFITLFLLATGSALMLLWDAPIEEWLQAVRINLTLVTLFLFVPLMGIPVKTGHYVRSLEVVLAQYMNRPAFFFLGSKLLTHILGVVLNIGSVSIVYYLSHSMQSNHSRILANAINRGFISTIFWSPYFSAMALILSQLTITWSSIVLFSLGLSLISFLVSLLVEWPYIRLAGRDKKEGDFDRGEPEKRKASRNVWELLFLLLFIMGSVLILEKLTGYPMVLVICLVSAVFPFLWCVMKKKRAEYTAGLKEHLFTQIPRMKREMVLFLVAGFFSGAIVHAELSQYLIDFIQSIFGSFTPGVSFFISLLIVVTAVFGVHPIVVVTILVTSIQPELLGMSPEYFAVLLLASWGISNTLSPATAVNNLLAHLLQADLLEVSISWNLKFVCIMLIVLPIYLFVIF